MSPWLLTQFCLFETENVSIIVFISPLFSMLLNTLEINLLCNAVAARSLLGRTDKT